MSPAPGLPSKVLTQPRPGHADLAGMLKYGLDDARDVLERASARETAARVAAGTVAKLLLGQIGVDVLSHIVQMGTAKAASGVRCPGWRTCPGSTSPRCAAPTRRPRSGWSPPSRRPPRPATRSAGWPRSSPTGCPSDSGSHVHWDRRLDALLAQALMSIQAIKAVEIGEGSEVAGLLGSEAHDAIRMADPGSVDDPERVGRTGAAATSATPTGPVGSRAA